MWKLLTIDEHYGLATSLLDLLSTVAKGIEAIPALLFNDEILLEHSGIKLQSARIDGGE